MSSKNSGGGGKFSRGGDKSSSGKGGDEGDGSKVGKQSNSLEHCSKKEKESHHSRDHSHQQQLQQKHKGSTHDHLHHLTNGHVSLSKVGGSKSTTNARDRFRSEQGGQQAHHRSPSAKQQASASANNAGLSILIKNTPTLSSLLATKENRSSHHHHKQHHRPPLPSPVLPNGKIPSSPKKAKESRDKRDEKDDRKRSPRKMEQRLRQLEEADLSDYSDDESKDSDSDEDDDDDDKVVPKKKRGKESPTKHHKSRGSKQEILKDKSVALKGSSPLKKHTSSLKSSLSKSTSSSSPSKQSTSKSSSSSSHKHSNSGKNHEQSSSSHHHRYRISSESSISPSKSLKVVIKTAAALASHRQKSLETSKDKSRSNSVRKHRRDSSGSISPSKGSSSKQTHKSSRHHHNHSNRSPSPSDDEDDKKDSGNVKAKSHQKKPLSGSGSSVHRNPSTAMKGPKSAFYPKDYLSQLKPLEVPNELPCRTGLTSPHQVFIPRHLQMTEQYVRETLKAQQKHLLRCTDEDCPQRLSFDLLKVQHAIENHLNSLEGVLFSMGRERLAYREFCERTDAKRRKVMGMKTASGGDGDGNSSDNDDSDDDDEDSRKKKKKKKKNNSGNDKDSSGKFGKKDSTAWFFDHWNAPDRMEKIKEDRRENPDTRRGDFDLAPGMEIIGRHRSKAALEAAMQLTVVSTAAYLSSPASGAHRLTEQNISRLNRIRKQLIMTPISVVSPPGIAPSSTTTTLSSTTKKSSGSKRGSGGKNVPSPSPPPPIPALPQQPYCSEFNQRFERLFADFDRFFVHDMSEAKHARPLEAYCCGQEVYQAVVNHLLDGRLGADFESLFEDAEMTTRNSNGEPFIFTGSGAGGETTPSGTTTPTTGLRASARIRRNRSSSDEWTSSTPSTPTSLPPPNYSPYSSHNGGSSPAQHPPSSPNVSNRPGKRPLPPLPASPITRQNGGSSNLSKSGFKIPRISATRSANNSSSTSTSTPTASTSKAAAASNPENSNSNGGEEQQPPSPTAGLFEDLFSFSGLKTRHQMKELKDTIVQNRQDALNSSCKSSEGLEANLRARQQEYLKGVLKGLRGGNPQGSLEPLPYADLLLKENLEASWSLLRLLNDHLALFGPQCYGCLASEKESKVGAVEGRLIASPGKRRGGSRRSLKMVNGFANSLDQGTPATSSSAASSSSKVFTPPANFPPITRGSARKRSLSECTKDVVISLKNTALLNHVFKQQQESNSFEASSHDSSSSSSVSERSDGACSSSASSPFSEKSSKSSSCGGSSNNSSRRGSSSSNASDSSNASNSSNGSNDSKNSSNGNGTGETSFDSRHQRQLPCPELEEAFDMASLIASWESASEAHGKTLAKSGGGGSSSRDYSYHHNHYNNHLHNHHQNNLLDPSMLIDDEHVKELHQKRATAKQGATSKAIHFVGLGELGLQQTTEDIELKQPTRKFFPIPSEDVPCLRSHDPFGIIDHHHHHNSTSNNVAESPRNSDNLNGSAFSAYSSNNSFARRRLSSSFEEDWKDDKTITESNSSYDDLGSTIKLLTRHLSSVARSNSRTVGDLWVKTQQELALQELREKTENHHALLCHEFTPYFSMKRKNNGVVPTATRNNILTTMANLSEDKSGADRIRREMGVAEYIDEVFRLRQSTLVAPPLNSTSDGGGLHSSDAAVNGNGGSKSPSNYR